MQKTLFLPTPFRHTDCIHTSSQGVWRISHGVIAQIWCWGPWTHALDCRAEAEQTLLPTTYLYKTGIVCPAGIFVQMIIFHLKQWFGALPLCPQLNTWTMKFSVCSGLQDENKIYTVTKTWQWQHHSKINLLATEPVVSRCAINHSQIKGEYKTAEAFPSKSALVFW